MQPTWGSLLGRSSKGVSSILTVPLFPGGFGAADASCMTATPANTTAVRTISQSALRLLILIACSFLLYLWDPGCEPRTNRTPPTGQAKQPPVRPGAPPLA